MGLIISDIQDASADVIDRSTGSVQINNVSGILAQTRRYLLRDENGQYTPFSPAGFFARNQYRNQSVEETNDAGFKLFTGSVRSVSWMRDERGIRTDVETMEPIGVLLKWRIDENSVYEQDGGTGLSNFDLTAAADVGDTTINLTHLSGTTGLTIPVPSMFAATDSLIPRYQITGFTEVGAGDYTITLDRALEKAIPIGSGSPQVYISEPVERTPADAIRRALISAGLTSRIGGSFSQIHASDTAANYKIWMHILTTDNVQLGQHIAQLLELGDLWMVYNTNTGTVDVIRGLEWQGNTIVDRLTDKEIMLPMSLIDNVDRLLYAYDTFYATGSEIGQAQDTVDQTLIDSWAASNVFQPIKPKDRAIITEKYLYNNATTADYFGARRINYDGVPRLQLKCRVKEYYSGSLRPVDIQLGKEYRVSFQANENTFFIDEPARVLGYNYNQKANLYDNVLLEFTNFRYPNITRSVQAPIQPEITIDAGIDSGFLGTWGNVIDATLKADIFMPDKSLKITAAEIDVDGSQISYRDTILQNGTTYFAKFWTVSGGLESNKTDFIAFTPTATGLQLGNGSDFLLLGDNSSKLLV